MKAAVFSKPGIKYFPPSLEKLLSCFDELLYRSDFADTTEKNYVKAIEKDVRTILEKNPNVLICVGGDGMASYVASAVIKTGCSKPPVLLGWGAGTANVGPIVSISCSENLEDYRTFTFDALRISDEDEVLGYAFNDLIVGSSFLGTVDGQTVNLDARAMAVEGRAVVCNPGENILKEDYRLFFNGKELGQLPFKVRQICASTVDGSSMYGRAVYGGLMQACGMENAACVAFMDRIAVDSRPWTWSYKGMVNTGHFCFSKGDCVEICCLTKDGQIIIDGNPFIRKGNRIRIECVPNAVSVLRSDL